MAYDFQSSVDEMTEETEISDLKKEVNKLKNSPSIESAKKEIDELSQINSETKRFNKKKCF